MWSGALSTARGPKGTGADGRHADLEEEEEEDGADDVAGYSCHAMYSPVRDSGSTL